MRLILCFILLCSLAVTAPADKPADDGVITDRVRQRLFGDPDVKGYTVEVETKNRVVTLSGTVETERAKARAEKITKKVSGVKSVVNKLRIELPRPK